MSWPRLLQALAHMSAVFPESFGKVAWHILPGPTEKKIFHTSVQLYALNHKLFVPSLALSESIQK